MKAIKGNLRLKISGVLWLLIGSTGMGAFGQDVSEIQASIKAKGQKWIAEETSISKLPDNEKKMRLGLIRHVSNGKEPVLSVESPALGLATSIDLTNFVTPVRNCRALQIRAHTAAARSVSPGKNTR